MSKLQHQVGEGGGGGQHPPQNCFVDTAEEEGNAKIIEGTQRRRRRFCDRIIFQVPDSSKCIEFYKTVLGMKEFHAVDVDDDVKDDDDDDNNPHLILLGYNINGLKIGFVDTVSTTTKPNDDDEVRIIQRRKSTQKDAYWKIGITVENLDSFIDQNIRRSSRNNNIVVSTPIQFMDIGYLCHLQDPAGLNIELLQQTFQKPKSDRGLENDNTISTTNSSSRNKDIVHTSTSSVEATIAHITIRSNNYNNHFRKLQNWCIDEQKMKLMSVMPVDLYNFTLYFYSFDNNIEQEECPPSYNTSMEDKETIIQLQREWLWQRPYGLLEIQHRHLESSSSVLTSELNQARPLYIDIVSFEEGGGGDEHQKQKIMRINCKEELGL